MTSPPSLGQRARGIRRQKTVWIRAICLALSQVGLKLRVRDVHVAEASARTSAELGITGASELISVTSADSSLNPGGCVSPALSAAANSSSAFQGFVMVQRRSVR